MSTWLVTGGSRGIGRAVVDHVAASGDRVASLARSSSAEPAAHPDRVLEVKADVADGASVRDGLRTVQEAFGSVDVIVNSAGVHRGGRVESLDREAWDEVVSTNLTGAFEVCRAAVPVLSAGASIVNVGAVVGWRGFPGDVAYGSAKAGLSGLTQVLAVELAPRGVRVNLVVPGFVDTDMTAGLSERARARVIGTIPAGRTGTAQEIAEVIVAVARSTYMTGATVPVDGGLLASFGGHMR
ncbi:SDR family NAD(P)-dependent oxidoreductase [Saccharopolyspora sp. TS4A08]|uniref:SDR family NAD(P)-dependent oxidoreductase n=1 Tax=Saccharopolyspora ipomoeae TaxID=3042027 RepID=A0ABT6PRA0_9PSEU|nr:SDR family NAD(P)-dependent oxidoreductase [Saccharopolyspora sp. TS4A08]MDI2030493.1 SDR family NAD(P)-dependent oxidoreductase [Saccharopolyspora sp. TS4A08]